ncbi:hypothetical protein FB451DRAFT_1185943 [Mycena latifolia]|nr:hypothetical protein FB451DRAFT_1185943 [Mycena latifolia]
MSTVTEIRLKNTVACLTPVIALLNELSDNFGTPFVPAISNTTLSLVNAVQNVRKNKEECSKLMEDIYRLLCGLVNLHFKSEPRGNLAPATWQHVGEFTETLHKIHTFVEAQQEGSKIKQLFRQTKTKTLLSECRAGVQQALEVFQVQQELDMMHKDVLELISTLSDGTASDRSSSIYKGADDLNSSKSISMLPAKPKIFHGREAELTEVVQILQQQSPRIAILGAGGMGKTSLVKAALHDPDIATKYEQCFFVVADSVTTSVELSALIGEHIGFKPANIQQVIQYFATTGPSLLILDNLETSWEPKESRREVEELLSKITDVPHLVLVVTSYLIKFANILTSRQITMRDAEQPTKVQWTHPFLSPLKPLSDLAARDTFFAIAEDMHDNKDIDEVLSLTDNMPLAVDLIAHAVDFEGSCSAVLARWKTEKTSTLSAGNDRRSNLDMSITISLSSSRMSTGAKDLLSLLSILPDGLSDVELVQSKLAITDIMTCKAALLATSLAYIDDKRHLKSLVPIREHVQRFYPPSPLFTNQLQRHFHPLLELYHKYYRTQMGASRVTQLQSNVGNIRQLLFRALDLNNPNLAEMIDCTLSLNLFTRQTELVYHPLNQMLLERMGVVPPPNCDSRFQAQLIIGILESRILLAPINVNRLIAQAISHFSTFDDPVLECRFYVEVGHYYFDTRKDITRATQYLHKALELAKSNADLKAQTSALFRLELSGEVGYQAVALGSLASCYRARGDLKNGILLGKRGIKLLQLSGTTSGSSYDVFMQNQAEGHRLKSEYAEARSIHTQIVPDITQEPTTVGHVFCLLNISELDIIMGASKDVVLHNLERVKRMLNSPEYRYINAPPAVIYCNVQLGKLHLREGETLAAKGIFQTGLDSTWGKDAQGVLLCMESLANVSQWPESDFHWASGWTVMYLGYAKKLGNKLALHQALQFMGDVVQAQGDSATSMPLFTVALEGFTWMDVHNRRAECMLRLGDLAKGRGDVLKAVKLWKLARPLFERSSQAKQIAQIDGRLSVITDDVLEEQMSSLTRLMHFNVSAAILAEVPHRSTSAGETDIEGGEKYKDNEHLPVLFRVAEIL